MRRPLLVRLGVLLLVLLGLLPAAEVLPTGFTDTVLAQYFSSPSACAVAPDGRVFVGEQAGYVWLVVNGTKLSQPFAAIAADGYSDRGVLGICFDPAFATNHFVYIFYTTRSTPTVNRVSRFDATTNVAGAETIIFQGDTLTTTFRNGGGIGFGADGKLYVCLGDGGVDANGQDMTTTCGKLLRLNADGSIPTDNPFVSTTSGSAQAIYCLGFRNIYSFAIQPTSGLIYCNDVRGTNNLQIVAQAQPAANFGWPVSIGATATAPYAAPLVAIPYGTDADQAKSITGGAFYTPGTTSFPTSYANQYFYCDFSNGWLWTIDPANPVAGTVFGTGLPFPVALALGADGNLYYIGRGDSALHVIAYQQQAPAFTQQPVDQTVQAGGSATFSVAITGSQPLTVQWQRAGVAIAGATSTTYTLSGVQPSDDLAQFSVLIGNAQGSLTSQVATLHVTSRSPPLPVILTPAAASTYTAGTVIAFSGAANDPIDGTLPPSALSWSITLHVNGVVTPTLSLVGGSQGTFTIPGRNLPASNVYYSIILTATDSGSVSASTEVDLTPSLAQLTVVSAPSGAGPTIDGTPAPVGAMPEVVGALITIDAPPLMQTAGITYAFASWSDGGLANHDVTMPGSDLTMTATYTAQPPATTSTTGGGTGTAVGTTTTTSTAPSSSGSHCGVGGLALLLSGLLLRGRGRVRGGRTAFRD